MQNDEKERKRLAKIALAIAVIALLFAIIVPIVTAGGGKIVPYEMGLVRMLNDALASDSQATGVEGYPTPFDAMQSCERGGFNVPRIVRDLDRTVAWDSVGQRFVLFDEEGKNYSYPEADGSVKTENVTGEKSGFFVVAESKSAAPLGFSIYAGENWREKSVALDGIGFDSGKTVGIEAVNYTNSGNAKSVVIRTDDYETALTVNAEKDVVNHYGKVNGVKITAVAMASYHEFGEVAGNIDLVKGSVVVENGCKASAVVIDMTAAELTTVTTISADNTKATYVPIVLNTTKEDWNGNAHKGLIDPEKNAIIYTFPGASSTVIGDDGQAVTTGDVDATAYNVSQGVYYTSVDKAIEDSEDGETVMLLKDDQIFKGYNRDDCPEIGKSDLTLNLNGHNLKWPLGVWLQGAENLTIKNGSLSGVTEGQSYSCFFGDEAETSVTLSNLTCVGGFNFYNTVATVTSCRVTLNAGYNVIWADEDSVITVTSGVYDATGRTVGQGVIGCDKDAFLTITGGTFLSNDDDILLTTTETSMTGEYEGDSVGVFIKGGAFNVNVTDFTFKKLLAKTPTEYEIKEHFNMLRSDYQAVKRNDLWVVVTK